MKSFTTEKVKIPTAGGRMKLLILKPVENRKPAEQTPGILWIHGGGYAHGTAEAVYLSRAMALVEKYGAVVLAPNYRLVRKAPYPAALEDCYAALVYLKEHTAELGVNPNQLMVGGESAGGGLTAALCMYARDKGEVGIAYQMPLYPMIDDRDTESSRDNHAPVWNTKKNHRAWKRYLRGLPRDGIPAYAAPARQTDYSGLPPAYTFVGDIEPFYCETLDFVEHLKADGVEAEADVYPGCFHAFDIHMPYRAESKEAIEKFEQHYLYAAEHYYKAQP